MYIKRIFDRKPCTCLKDGKPAENCEKCRGRGFTPQAIKGIKMLRVSKIQRLSPHLVDGGVIEGWLTLGKGKLVISDIDGKDYSFRVVRTPGNYYCCHCEGQIVDAAVLINVAGKQLTVGQKHVLDAHAGSPSPDPSNPSGYRKEDYYTVVSDEAIENMTPEQAAEMDKKVREELIKRLGKKFRPKAFTTAKVVGFLALFILGILAQEMLAFLFAVPGIVLAADFCFNISKGRAAELYNRVDLSDPTNAVLVVTLLASTGLEAQSVLEDKDDFAAVVSGTTNEATNTGYARKVLSDVDIAAFAPDDTNNRVDLDIPDQTWTGLANDGTGAIGALVVNYDPDSTVGADSAIVPISHHTFSITPDGSDVTAVIASAGFFRAS